jgi:NAD(P)-dependent dehydrogenase (short-subunit alcohol dehydrogenase family)
LALKELQAAAKSGGSAIGVICDLQDFGSVRSAADTVLQHPRVQQQGLDVLCNNAGMFCTRTLLFCNPQHKLNAQHPQVQQQGLHVLCNNAGVFRKGLVTPATARLPVA